MNPFCADPRNKHKKKIKNGLHKVTDAIVLKCAGALEKGTWICVNCINSLSVNPLILSDVSQQSEGDVDPLLVAEANLSSPAKKRVLPESQKQPKGAKKLKGAGKALKNITEDSNGVANDTLTVLMNADANPLLAKFENIMQELKEAFQMSKNYKRRIQILTLSPFTTSETETFFEASHRMVIKSEELKKEYGILPEILSINDDSENSQE